MFATYNDISETKSTLIYLIYIDKNNLMLLLKRVYFIASLFITCSSTGQEKETTTERIALDFFWTACFTKKFMITQI